MAQRKGRSVKSRLAKARSEAAKRGWETRRKLAAERQRELERRRRSEAAKRGWETRRKREAEEKKKRPPVPVAPSLEDWLEGYEDWDLWFTGADEWQEDEWEGTASYEESR